MKVTHDPNWNEPIPRKFHAIKCFSCNKLLPGKSHTQSHKGHDVHYVNKDGSLDEN